MAQKQKNYQIADNESLESILSVIAMAKQAQLADIQQYDIIYTVGNLKALIKVELSKDSVRVLYDDFINSRSAPVPVKAAVAKFVREVASPHKATSDEMILQAHFVEPSFNEFKQQQAAFLNGSSGKISFQDSHPAVNLEVANSEDVRSMLASLSSVVPNLKESEAQLLIRSQIKLDALSRPAAGYGSGGNKRKISIFSKNTDGSQESEQASRNAPTTPSINNRK